jgi:hypothetical protein
MSCFDEKYPDIEICPYCNDVVGYCACYPPLDVVVYDNYGNAIEWSGPIGCMRPEDRMVKGNG